jgi:hypothetical protein
MKSSSRKSSNKYVDDDPRAKYSSSRRSGNSHRSIDTDDMEYFPREGNEDDATWSHHPQGNILLESDNASYSSKSKGKSRRRSAGAEKIDAGEREQIEYIASMTKDDIPPLPKNKKNVLPRPPPVPVNVVSAPPPAVVTNAVRRSNRNSPSNSTINSRESRSSSRKQSSRRRSSKEADDDGSVNSGINDDSRSQNNDYQRRSSVDGGTSSYDIPQILELPEAELIVIENAVPLSTNPHGVNMKSQDFDPAPPLEPVGTS